MTIELDISKLNLPTTNTLNKAIASSINKSVVTAKKELSIAVRAYYDIKKKDLDPKIKVNKATMNDTQSIITVRSKPIGLIHFGAKSLKAFDKGQKRYFKTSAKVLKQSGRKVYKGAFIAKAKDSNSWQVFRRRTNKKLPLIKVSVITPTTMVEREGEKIFLETVDRRVKEIFFHELKYFTEKQK